MTVIDNGAGSNWTTLPALATEPLARDPAGTRASDFGVKYFRHPVLLDRGPPPTYTERGVQMRISVLAVPMASADAGPQMNVVYVCHGRLRYQNYKKGQAYQRSSRLLRAPPSRWSAIISRPASTDEGAICTLGTCRFLSGWITRSASAEKDARGRRSFQRTRHPRRADENPPVRFCFAGKIFSMQHPAQMTPRLTLHAKSDPHQNCRGRVAGTP